MKVKPAEITGSVTNIDGEEYVGLMNVPKEDLEYLRGLITEINTQDNRATATPYYYDLRWPDTCAVSGRPIELKVEYGQTVFFTEKAADAYIKANKHNLPEGTYAFLCWGGRNPQLQNLL